MKNRTKLGSMVYFGKPNLFFPPNQIDIFAKFVHQQFKTQISLNQFWTGFRLFLVQNQF